MKLDKPDLLEMAVEITKSALESPTGNVREVGKPDDTVAFLQAVYDKLVEINESVDQM